MDNHLKRTFTLFNNTALKAEWRLGLKIEKLFTCFKYLTFEVNPHLSFAIGQLTRADANRQQIVRQASNSQFDSYVAVEAHLLFAV